MDTFFTYRTKNSVIVKSLSTGGIIELSRDDYDNPKTNFKTLINQVNTITPFYKSSDKTTKTLDLMIVTTMKCNLTCSYCFENDKSRDISISADQANKIILYIKKCMSSGHYDNLDICFTGGEPLLSYRHIRNIVKTLNSEYASLDIKYSIITNGTLLNKSIITFLSNNKFTVQISFDGDKYFHNLERKYTNGFGSYERLMTNVNLLLSSEQEISLKVRINVTKINYNNLSNLFDDLSKYHHQSRLSIYPDFVAVSPKEKTYISQQQKISIMKTIFIQLYEKGFNIIGPIMIGGMCMYKNDYSTTIHADGSLYNCYSVVGNSAFEIENIEDTNEIPSGIGDMCSDYTCPFHNLCYGGCPYNELVLTGKMQKDCQKEYLSEMNTLMFKKDISDLYQRPICKVEDSRISIISI